MSTSSSSIASCKQQQESNGDSKKSRLPSNSNTAADDDDDNNLLLAHGVRRVTALQLVSHALCTQRLWAQSLLTEPALLPRIAVFNASNNSTAWRMRRMECVAASMYLATLVLQVLWPTITLATRQRRVFLLLPSMVPWLCFLSWLFLVLFCDICHLQPPILSGLGCLLAQHVVVDDASSSSLVRLVLASTWMWSGLHKLNPAFLTRAQFRMVDHPLLAWIWGQKAVEHYRMTWRVMVAAAEALAGAILLVNKNGSRNPTTRRRDTTANNALLATTSIRISLFFILAMHLLIVERLISSNWNFHVLGWNVCYFYLAIRLWWPHCAWCSNSRLIASSEQDDAPPTPAPTLQTAPTNKDGEGNKYHCRLWQLVYVMLFAILPAAVWVGLDPYLGSALYTNNLPILRMELPVGSAANDYTFYQLYQSWGLVLKDDDNDDSPWQADYIPTSTTDNGRIVQTDYLHFALRTTGSVGYPALWAHRRLAAALCQTLRQVQLLNNDADEKELAPVRFLLEEPYTGKVLARALGSAIWHSLLGQQDESSSLPPPLSPTTWVQQGCTGNWEPFSWPIQADSHAGLFAERKTGVSVEFSAMALDPPITLYWVKDQISRTKSPSLVFQQELQPQPVAFTSFQGHRFVATRPRRPSANPNNGNVDSSSLCFVKLWVIPPVAAGQTLRFAVGPDDVDDSRNTTLPGMPSWWVPCGLESEIGNENDEILVVKAYDKKHGTPPALQNEEL